MKKLETRYLERLSDLYPTIGAASTEIINLQAILNLPKGTEHFLSDIHGEYEAFAHVLKNGSGTVRNKIEDVFGNTISSAEKKTLATLIYYPKEKIDLIRKTEDNMETWYKTYLYRLIEVSKRAASKYTRSKVRKSLPKDFAYVIEELITEKAEISDKESYYSEIISTIIKIGRAEEFICAIAELIQRLVVDHLHIIGDIYDRGPGPHIIMDKLMGYHSVDIQWGNHDILWMGAAAGQRACIANVIRICARYGNLDILEEGYGINLLPLATFAIRVYGDDPCLCFHLKNSDSLDPYEKQVNLRIHKAISILQFKIEGQTAQRRTAFRLMNRAMLHKIDYENGTIMLDGKKYKLMDTNFPTVDEKRPYALTPEEEEVMSRLEHAFLNCEKLQHHVRFLLAKGGMYKICNENLLYHGCVPLSNDGELKDVNIYGKTYKGKQLFDVLETYVRKAFFAIDEEERREGCDIMWYIWLHPDSPLFGKAKMATFERYFLKEKEEHVEEKNTYYRAIDDEKVIDKILLEFGLDPKKSHIVNGHVPVKMKDGENPIKCGGKVLVIDGGFSRSYQSQTGIAGYTLIYNSYGMRLVAHEPFVSAKAAISQEIDIHSETMVITKAVKRHFVGDTDVGKELQDQVRDLEWLLDAYRKGEVVEKFEKDRREGF